jgi:hypothetical protein
MFAEPQSHRGPEVRISAMPTSVSIRKKHHRTPFGQPSDRGRSKHGLRRTALEVDGRRGSRARGRRNCSSICAMIMIMPNSNEFNLSEDLKRRARDANKTLVSAIDPFLQGQFTSDGLPDRLCHYTDFGGLKGILESGALWATYSRTLNDASEQQYGEKVIRDYLANLSGGGVADRLSMVMGPSNRRNFASCFCESSQILSMWTTYASRGGGYCLEFDGVGNLLRSSLAEVHALPFKMTYGKVLPQNVQSALQCAWRFAQPGRC